MFLGTKPTVTKVDLGENKEGTNVTDNAKTNNQHFVDDTVGLNLPEVEGAEVVEVTPEDYTGMIKVTPETMPPRPVFSTPKEEGKAPDLTDSGFQTLPNDSAEVTDAVRDGMPALMDVNGLRSVISQGMRGNKPERPAVYVVAKSSVAADCKPHSAHNPHHHHHTQPVCAPVQPKCGSPQPCPAVVDHQHCPAAKLPCVLASQTCQGGPNLDCFDKVSLVDTLSERHIQVPLTSSQVNDIWLASQGIVPMSEEEVRDRREARRMRRQEAKEAREAREARDRQRLREIEEEVRRTQARERVKERFLRRIDVGEGTPVHYRSYQREDSSDDEAAATISTFKPMPRRTK